MTNEDLHRLHETTDEVPLVGRTSWSVVVATILICILGLVAVYAVNTYQAFGRNGRAEKVQESPP